MRGDVRKIGRGLMAVGALAAAEPCPADEAKKNVLLIMVDDLKPSLGCYGDRYAVTPAMDALASDGVLYERAYCQQALSGPSRASIMTGLRPDENGVTELDTWIREKNENVVTLPQAFREAGYTTASVGKTFHGKRNTLDSLSWSVPPVLYEYSKNDEYMLSENKTGKKAASFEFHDGPEKEYLDMKIRKQAVKSIRKLARSGDPFFLAVGFLKPHLPFCAPERFLDMYRDRDMGKIDTSRIKGAPSLAYHDGNELRGYIDIGKAPISMDKHLDLKRSYYSCVSFADENIGVVIKALKESGLYDNTVIVLVGDHGYHLGDQGLWCKSTNYEEACRSPLVIRYPSGSKGHRVGAPVELVDIFPTLTSVCDIEAPEGLSGKDLTDFDENAYFCALSQFPRPYRALHKAASRTHMGYTARDPKWRYVQWFDNDGVLAACELYDMERTGEETVNVAGRPEYASVENKLGSLISEYRYGNESIKHNEMKPELLSNPYFVKAMEYIRTHDLASMENGTHKIDGDNLYLNIVDSKLRPREKARLEVHDEYIDIQVPLSGPEIFGVKDRSLCANPSGDMNKEKDIMFYDDPDYDLKTVGQGEIVVFAPGDAHAPLIGEGTVHKAIFKVKVQ